MRKLFLLALAGMAFSKVSFGSFVPPELQFKAPGFNILKEGANAPKPYWFTNPAHLHPVWMQASASSSLAHPGGSRNGIHR